MTQEMKEEIFMGVENKFNDTQKRMIEDLYDAAEPFLNFCGDRKDFKEKLAELNSAYDNATLSSLSSISVATEELPTEDDVDVVPEGDLELNKFGAKVHSLIEHYLMKLGLNI